jgi:hypothetical protein
VTRRTRASRRRLLGGTDERRLHDDLDTIAPRAADEAFATSLYRELARNVWRRDREDAELSPSFSRAEWLVNAWRERHGRATLTLAQTGAEGEVDATAGDELARLGWSHRPLNTGREEPTHEGLPVSPPPGTVSARRRRAASDERDRHAHEEADAELRRKAT